MVAWKKIMYIHVVHIFNSSYVAIFKDFISTGVY
jgi:hypothetical protein